MKLDATLTKENFFNGMMEAFPKATKHFCKWIDEYKKAVNWEELFGNVFPTEQKIKFHHIPYAMQVGIWLEYTRQTLSEFFEQADYAVAYDGAFDLEEEIKDHFESIEPLIDEED